MIRLLVQVPNLDHHTRAGREPNQPRSKPMPSTRYFDPVLETWTRDDEAILDALIDSLTLVELQELAEDQS